MAIRLSYSGKGAIVCVTEYLKAEEFSGMDRRD
ncbi:uncharacterized protein METZ01_LOCUS353504, partial [marine metagenome]